jgi:UDP-3-O-[3-hydroxymyristoyl] glucosamine N-acyltransferase
MAPYQRGRIHSERNYRMKLSELAAALGQEVRSTGGLDPQIDGVANSATAAHTSIVFAESAEAIEVAERSAAAAIIARAEVLPERGCTKPVMLARNPKLAFARAAKLLRVEPASAGIHPSASVSPDAVIARDVEIGPYAVVGASVTIGARSRIGAGAVLGDGVQVGEDCRIYPRVVMYSGTELGDRVVVHAGAVLGADGFGYVRDEATGEYTQFPQQGRLIVGDDVEIGANTTVDRGALEATRIEPGVKLDNLVHVGHNVKIARNVVIAAQTGVSGSTTIGEGAVIAGQVGLGDHVTIGEGVIIGGQGGVLPGKKLRGSGVFFWGTPARPVREYLKELATLTRLSRQAGKKTEE